MISYKDIISVWETFWSHPRVFITAAFFSALVTYSALKSFPSLIDANVTPLRDQIVSLNEANASILKDKAALQKKLVNVDAKAKDLNANLTVAQDETKKYKSETIKNKNALDTATRAFADIQSRLAFLQAENAKLSKPSPISSQTDKPKPELNVAEPQVKTIVLSDDARKVLAYFFDIALASDTEAGKALHMAYGRIALSISQLVSNGFLEYRGGSNEFSLYKMTPTGAAFAERNGIVNQ